MEVNNNNGGMRVNKDMMHQSCSCGCGNGGCGCGGSCPHHWGGSWHWLIKAILVVLLLGLVFSMGLRLGVLLGITGAYRADGGRMMMHSNWNGGTMMGQAAPVTTAPAQQ